MKKMNKYLILSIILTLVLVPATARAVPEGTSGGDMNLGRMSDGELLKYGEQLLEREQSDSALLCFVLINNHAPADKNLYAKSLLFAGNAYYSRSSYAKAMESYMTSLRVCEENDIEELLPEIYKSIGNIYSMFHDFRQSSALYTKSLNLARKRGDRVFVNKMLSNLICAYTPQTSIQKYWEYYEELSSHKEDRPRYKYDLLMDKGMILTYEKKYKEAIGYFRKTVDFSLKNDMSPIGLASAYTSLADAYQALGNRDSSLYYLMKNKEIGERIKFPALMIITLRNLSEIYHNVDERKSLEYKSEYLALSDSVFNINEFNGIRNALYYYEMDNKLKTINSLSETNRASVHEIMMQRRWLVTLTIFSVVVVLLVVLVYVQKRRLARSYQHLFHKSMEELATEKIYARRIKEIQKRMGMMQCGESVSDEAAVADTLRPQAKLSEEQRDALLDSIMQVMEHGEEFCDSEFSIERLSTLVNSNSRYVSRVINDVYSKNFRTFLNEFRVKKAMMRMSDTENYGQYTIKAIAESVGYKSQSNFINVFTRQTGIKPSVFQKLSQEKILETDDYDAAE
ncbi:MAG: helix-turn-helix domain-containing protein [Prevotella sp.]|uniref:helix-turn-helix domain-containing protein n=1 Tax=Prevotella sp. TaxID=59823 RepID=UPI002A2E48B8|nr:helix-turn-helix domain-containing protein [Prevotella sp.]MDD7317313.1 helix-turn-helix domain-containing protein [Prevotellaceae bacterium]MDY4019917.1 helix-turn-helix domain-containing protein [Prevotella sp.]